MSLVAAAAAQNPCFQQQQKIIIPNKRGEKLVGILHESGTTDIVILCHGCQSSKDFSLIVNLAVALDNAQISSFRFDFAGNGESEGTLKCGNFWEEVDDLLAVVQHFRELNRDIRAIVGHSMGGDVVLLYASKYHQIKTVVNISGRYDLKAGNEERLGNDFSERIRKDGFIDMNKSSGSLMDRLGTNMHEACFQIYKECRWAGSCLFSLCVAAFASCCISLFIKKRSESFDYRVTEESLMDRLGINMHDACLQIDKDCRVCTIHGSSDKTNSVQDALEFAKIIPNHELHIIEGADHFFTNHQDELSSVFVRFIKETMHQNKCTRAS